MIPPPHTCTLHGPPTELSAKTCAACRQEMEATGAIRFLLFFCLALLVGLALAILAHSADELIKMVLP